MKNNKMNQKYAKCYQCKKNFEELPYNCNYCKKSFCSHHRLPEYHHCKPIEIIRNGNRERWKETIKEIYFPSTSYQKFPSNHKKSRTQSDEEPYEMYLPERKTYSSYSPEENFSLNDFLRKHIFFRVQNDVKPHLIQFLLIFLMGIVLNYVYYQTFSLSYLFIGGLNEWFNILIPAINYGLRNSYDLVYLIINGIYYAYFYYSFVLVVYHTIINLDEEDTWIMLVWVALVIWAFTYFFPQIG